jgi:hypothetical protein
MHREEGSMEYLEAMKREIATRLRPVCPSMPAEEFDELVDRIARVNMKYKSRRTDDLFDPDQLNRVSPKAKGA